MGRHVLNEVRPISICLVEDHDAVRSHLTELFQLQGFEILAAVGNAAGGETAIVANAPHVAVVDGRLPDGRGIDLCSRVRKSAPDVPLILYSAQVAPSEERAALDLGVAAVVLKNVRTDELLEAIRKHAHPITSESP